MIGRTLSHYKVLEKIGEGGMGEVYLAKDTKLDREVAVKVLPRAFSENKERLARFEREAKLLASMNHPNIAAIHELEESDGVHFLALEYVPGETLAERIRRGPVPIDEALPLFQQIAEGLEAAHEKGVIHRDLKPANIKVTPEGKVKVLDFGLAKAMAGETPTQQLSESPTITRDATETGVLLGTAPYMSPEQARGKAADKRTDIWAFGCCLYEALTGKAAYLGETVTDTIAKIVEREPDWEALPATTPILIQSLLRRCLHKEADRRIHDIADVRIELESHGELEWGEADGQRRQAQGLSATRFREKVAWALAAALGLLSAVVAVWHFTSPSMAVRPIRLSILPPSHVKFSLVQFAVAPDGSMLAHVGITPDGKRGLYVRPLDSVEPRLLAGTDDANLPFWSPDSRFIGFFAEGKLKKVLSAGGVPEILCDAHSHRGGTWGRHNEIVFSSEGRLQLIPAEGGQPVQVVELNHARKETGHLHPYFLPDGRHFLYLARSTDEGLSGVYIGSTESQETKRLLSAHLNAEYAPPGYLLVANQDRLTAQQFDSTSFELTGDPFTVAESVRYNPGLGLAGFSVSDNGVLLYHSGEIAGLQQPLWFDRDGTNVGAAGPTGVYDVGDATDPGIVSLSPDGRSFAAERVDVLTGNVDIWLTNLLRGTSSRFTMHPSQDTAPIWSPDGQQIAFSSSRDGNWNVFHKPIRSTGEGMPVRTLNNAIRATSWSPDGRHLLCESRVDSWDSWLLPFSDDEEPFPITETPFDERQGRFSPDGKWISYTSVESGSPEIYVQPFPSSGEKWQVSTGGGTDSRWRADGKELFYLRLDQALMSVEIDPTDPALQIGTPKPLFETGIRPFGGAYDVTGDGQRFLITTITQERSSITVVLNWMADSRQ